MAHSDRDQRHRPLSAKRCPEARNGGCGYCITGDAKPAARRTGRRNARKEIAAQTREITQEAEAEEAIAAEEAEAELWDNDYLDCGCCSCCGCTCDWDDE